MIKVLKYLYVEDKYEIYPFLPFAYENEKWISIVFYNSKIDELGDIIIDVGFTKLFNELNSNFQEELDLEIIG